MKGTHVITLDSPTARFKLELSRQYTEVIGDSGTGKTLITHIVEMCYRNLPRYSMHVSTDASVVVLTAFMLRQGFVGNTIYIIDEDVSTAIFSNNELESMFLSKARKSDCYFLLMCRVVQRGTPCSILRLCKLETVEVTDKDNIVLSQV
ncbi:MAG: hypothetical protein K2P14_10810 [Anaeroplasmataceae bacterium]|nr:hypothetical protein [Anaeroplasmataceae bacterium]